MNSALYDQIGKSYDNTRKADPTIVKRLYEFLNPEPNCQYLDVGCGSGNYTIALAQKGAQFTGLDISTHMLEMGRKKYPSINWVHGDARALPFPNNSFDGILCFLAIHHIRDLDPFFSEVLRVLRSGGKFLLFTNTPEQFNNLWFTHYFPKMMQKAASILFSREQVENAFSKAGFHSWEFEKYFVNEHVKDGFFEVAKYRPTLLLDEEFCRNITPIALAPDQNEIKNGLHGLHEDICSGDIQNVINLFENSLGEFHYILAHKVDSIDSFQRSSN